MGRARAVQAGRHSVRVTRSGTEALKREIIQYTDCNGFLSWSRKDRRYVILGTNAPKRGLVRCPACGIGELMVIRAKATRKRFMGCSNFYGGCRASSPLLQRARLRGTKRPCAECGWPVIIFRYSRNQKWTKQCSNIGCATRGQDAGGRAPRGRGAAGPA